MSQLPKLGGFLQQLRDELAKRFPNYFPLFGGMKASLKGFALKIVDSEGQTTTRQTTGQTGKDFQFFPVIRVVPDVNGTFEVNWNWKNYFDGAAVGYSTPTIVNTFPNLVAGQAVDLQLIDNRDPSTGRDPSKNGSIAIGDDAFIALGKQDGLWHRFKSDVTVLVKSPSGASANTGGSLGPDNYPENFKSAGLLTLTMSPFALNIIS